MNKSSNPLISVIVAVYNREKYLAECINSILNQTFRNFELILIDDGSTDNTPEIAKQFQDFRFKYISKPHTRCWDSKNRGIIESSGKYIVYIDSDDYLSPDFIENSLNEINKHPDFDYYYPERLEIVLENGRSTNRIWRYLDFPVNDRWKLINLFFHTSIGGIPHTGAFVRKEVFEKFGKFDEKLYNFGDTAYVVKNADKIKFKLIPQIKSYFKRHHETQICKNMLYRTKTISNLMNFVIENYPKNYIYPEYQDNNQELSKFYSIVVERLMKLAENCKPFDKIFIDQAKHYILQQRNLNT